LSRDGTWDTGDRLLGSVAVGVDLTSGGTYSRSVTAPFIPLGDGEHRIIVRTDLFDAVEETDEGDNTRVAGVIDVEIPVLEAGPGEVVTLAEGEMRFRRILPTDGLDLRVTAEPEAEGATELRVGHRRVPTAYDYDLTTDTPDDVSVLVPRGETGEHVVAVRGRPGAGTGTEVSLRLDVIGHEITAVTPNRGSRRGNATVVVRGGGFDEGAALLLRDGATTEVAGPVVRGDSTKLQGTFDLRDLDPGSFDVVVRNPDGTEAVAVDGFTVNDEPEGELELSLTAPEVMRTTEVGTIRISFRNTGATDLGTSLLRLTSGDEVFLLPGLAVAGPSGSGSSVGLSPGNGPLPVVAPYAEGSFALAFLPSAGSLQQVAQGGDYDMQATLEALSADDDTPYDFGDTAALRPEGLTDEQWAEVEAEVEARLDTVGDYVIEMLGVGEVAAAGPGQRAGQAGGGAWAGSAATDDGFLEPLPLDPAVPLAGLTGPAPGVMGTDSEAELRARFVRDVADDVAGASVRGQVHAEGRPVGRAGVWLVDRSGRRLAAGLTARDGTFALFGVHPGRYELQVEGHAPVGGPPTVVVEEGATGPSVAVEVESGRRLTGQVVSTGGAVPGGSVWAESLVDGTVAVAPVADGGGFVVSGLPEGSALVRVQVDGRPRGMSQMVEIGPDGGVADFVVPGGGAIVGTVTDGGAPVERALVRIRPAASMPDAQPGAATLTDADGTFRLSDLPPGTWDLSAHVGGDSPQVAVATGVVVAGSGTADAGILVLGAGATLTGTVRVEGTGTPVAGASVTVAGAGSGPVPAVTSADGTYLLEALPAGPVEVHVDADGYLGSVAAGAGTLDIDLRPAGAISGLVRQSTGEPLAGVSVVLSGGMVTAAGVTDGSGRYAFSDLPDGTYSLLVGSGDGATVFATRRQVTLDLADNAAVEDVVLTYGAVAGQVVDGGGGPLGLADVQLLDAGGELVAVTTSDASGRYRFRVFEPGDHTVVVAAEGQWSDPAPVTVAAGETAVVAPLGPRAGHTVSLALTLPGGAPAAGASVALLPDPSAGHAPPDDAPVGGSRSAFADDGGLVALADLPDGDYVLEARAEGAAVTRAPLTVAGADLAVPVALGASRRLWGRVTTAAADSPPEVSAIRADGLSVSTQGRADGTYVLGGLPDGTYEVWARTVDGAATATVVVAGGDVERGFTIPADGPATGVVRGVVSVDGDPLAGAAVVAVAPGGHVVVRTVSGPDGSYELSGLPAAEVLVVSNGLGPEGDGVLVTPTPGAPITLDLAADPLVAMAAPPVPGGPGGIPLSGGPMAEGGGDGVAEAAGWGLEDQFNYYLPVWRGAAHELFPPPRPVGGRDFGKEWIDFLPQPGDDPCPPMDDALDEARRAADDLARALAAWNDGWKAAVELADSETNVAFGSAGLTGARAVMSMAQLATSASKTLIDTGRTLDALVHAGKLAPAAKVAAETFLDLLSHTLQAGADAYATGNFAVGDYILGGFKAMLKGFAPGAGQAGVGSLTEWLAGLKHLYGNDLFTPQQLKLLESGALAKGFGSVLKHLGAFDELMGVVKDMQKLREVADAAFDAAAAAEQTYNQGQDAYLSAAMRYSAAMKRVRDIGTDCKPAPPAPPTTARRTVKTRLTNSRDPNEITGPSGQGPERLVHPGQRLDYSISFENLASASAAAQEVVVTHELAPDAELDSFELGSMRVAGIDVVVPPGRRDFTTSIPLEDSPGWMLAIKVGLDPDSRIATWRFRTIDPATGDLPAFTADGFLPPNLIPPEGEGQVQFSVQPSDGTPVGTEIDASASIVFDANDPIVTNTWTNVIGQPTEAGGPGFHPLVPARILDTRSGNGSPVAPLGDGETRVLDVAGRGGVPESGATAVVLNVTAVGASAASHLTVWSGDGSRPTASNLNFVAGQTIANQVVVELDSDGEVSLFNNDGAVGVVADVVGWFDEGTAGGLTVPPGPEAGDAFTAMTPGRLVDSRRGWGTATGPWADGQTRDVTVRGGSTGVPTDATAVVLNVTAVGATAPSHLTVWPKGVARPTASSLNMVAGLTIPNAVVVPVGVDGQVSIFNNDGEVDVVVDVVGWFAPGAGAAYDAITPKRLVDSRNGTGTTPGPWGDGQTREVVVAGGTSTVPAAAGAVLVNVTAVGPSAASHLTVWPTGVARPTASNLNFGKGVTIPNMVWVKVGTGGRISIFNNDGDAHVLVDVVGYMIE
jgi:hypothetical protein